jgi:hypothetical protein
MAKTLWMTACPADRFDVLVLPPKTEQRNYFRTARNHPEAPDLYPNPLYLGAYRGISNV